MKKLLCCACAALLCAATAYPCFAADSSWNGTWKLDQAKSTLTGDTFTITKKADGMYTFSNGSTVSYDFACNGKAYPTIADRTLTCTGTLATGFDRTVMAGSTLLSKSHRTISADGKTMTIHGTSMHPDGTSTSYDETYKRIAGTSGIEGKWKDVKDEESGSQIVVMAVNGNMIRVGYPQNKEVIAGKLDGSDSAVTGPRLPAGIFEAFKAEGPDKLHFTFKYKTKVLDEGTDTLSDNGKVLTVEEWNPGKMSEKEILVYEKQ